ncbi:hypothetical protein H9P43_006139 [Blastocladiella emersonii ATCC 22665]|nr:hypothetical protein H9P43_006139 [Blastocladiella emersonii ATCC 22665]
MDPLTFMAITAAAFPVPEPIVHRLLPRITDPTACVANDSVYSWVESESGQTVLGARLVSTKLKDSGRRNLKRIKRAEIIHFPFTATAPPLNAPAKLRVEWSASLARTSASQKLDPPAPVEGELELTLNAATGMYEGDIRVQDRWTFGGEMADSEVFDCVLTITPSTAQPGGGVSALAGSEVVLVDGNSPFRLRIMSHKDRKGPKRQRADDDQPDQPNDHSSSSLPSTTTTTPSPEPAAMPLSMTPESRLLAAMQASRDPLPADLLAALAAPDVHFSPFGLTQAYALLIDRHFADEDESEWRPDDVARVLVLLLRRGNWTDPAVWSAAANGVKFPYLLHHLAQHVRDEPRVDAVFTALRTGTAPGLLPPQPNPHPDWWPATIFHPLTLQDRPDRTNRGRVIPRRAIHTAAFCDNAAFVVAHVRYATPEASLAKNPDHEGNLFHTLCAAASAHATLARVWEVVVQFSDAAKRAAFERAVGEENKFKTTPRGMAEFQVEKRGGTDDQRRTLAWVNSVAPAPPAVDEDFLSAWFTTTPLDPHADLPMSGAGIH